MCQFSWFTTVVVLPHKSPWTQVNRCENNAHEPKSYRKQASVSSQVARFPTPVKHAAVVGLNNVTPAEENGTRIQNNRPRLFLPEREDGAVIREELRDGAHPLLLSQSHPSLNCFHLFSVFFPCLVLCFFAHISWLGETKGEERGQLM